MECSARKFRDLIGMENAFQCDTNAQKQGEFIWERNMADNLKTKEIFMHLQNKQVSESTHAQYRVELQLIIAITLT